MEVSDTGLVHEGTPPRLPDPRKAGVAPVRGRARTLESTGPLLPFLRSEEHTSELQSQSNLVCRLLLEKKKHFIKDLKMNLILVANRPISDHGFHSPNIHYKQKQYVCDHAHLSAHPRLTLPSPLPYVLC